MSKSELNFHTVNDTDIKLFRKILVTCTDTRKKFVTHYVGNIQCHPHDQSIFAKTPHLNSQLLLPYPVLAIIHYLLCRV